MISGLRFILAAAAFTLWTFTATAAGNWTLNELTDALQRGPSDHVGFTEHRHIRYLSDTLVSSGTMHFTDGVLFKKVTSPEAETFEIRNDQVIHTNAADEKTRIDVNEYPVLRGLVVTLRAVLGGNINSLRDLFDLGLSGMEKDWTLVMTPLGEALSGNLRKIVLQGSAGQVQTIQIDERNGDKTVIKVEHE